MGIPDSGPKSDKQGKPPSGRILQVVRIDFAHHQNPCLLKLYRMAQSHKKKTDFFAPIYGKVFF